MDRELELYESQLNFVEEILDAHPEFKDFIAAFSQEDQQVFHRYFLPDWDAISDFRAYYAQLMEQQPQIKERAVVLFREFLEKMHIEPEGSGLI